MTLKLTAGKQNNQRRHILALNYVFTKQNIHEVLLKALEFCEYHTHSDSGQMQCILKSLFFRFRILFLVASVMNIALIHIQLRENTGKILIYTSNSMWPSIVDLFRGLGPLKSPGKLGDTWYVVPTCICARISAFVP